MKHSVKIIALLLAMFFITQLIGIMVISIYSPQIKQIKDEQGNIVNITSYNLPYGLEPPQNTNPKFNLISIVVSIAIAVTAMLLLMKFNAAKFIRVWFFFVVILAIGITINAIFLGIGYSALIAILLALPLAFYKIFKRNIIVHNITELMIYPGIASLFVPLLNILTIGLLLVLISIYDIYAVWHAGFMQKMAKYQIQKLRIFSGFFIPYLSPKERLKALKKKGKKQKLKFNVAILGGGDIVFPIILAGVVLRTFGLLEAIIIAIGATAALGCLFYISEKGKFYPAMPFISAGCFIALGIVYLLRIF